MSALSAARAQLVFRGTIKKLTYPLAAGATAWEGGLACIDTSAYGSVKQGQVSTTLIPIGWFIQSVNNSAGGSTVPVGVELFTEKDISYWDSVTGAGAITSANLFQPVYIADDHTLTTVSTGASEFGRVWAISPQGYPNAVGVQAPVSSA
jgi:hypothetical protein